MLTSPACLAIELTWSGSLAPSTADKTAASTFYYASNKREIENNNQQEKKQNKYSNKTFKPKTIKTLFVCFLWKKGASGYYKTAAYIVCVCSLNNNKNKLNN